MIETERLVIREFRITDARDLYEYLSDETTYRFEPGEPIGQEEALSIADERSKGRNFFAVELKSEGRMIGHLYWAREEPPEFLAWEIGYIFNRTYQGKGYCSEAVRAFLGDRIAQPDVHRINAYCNPENIASWRVLEKAGMKREGYFRKKGFFRKDCRGMPLWFDCYAYGILAGE
jgi:RimJ/RimL family protein N-acetyltransferase